MAVYMYIYVCVCRGGELLTDRDCVDARRESRRDTMDLLREAKSSNSANSGSTPMHSSCKENERETL